MARAGVTVTDLMGELCVRRDRVLYAIKSLGLAPKSSERRFVLTADEADRVRGYVRRRRGCPDFEREVGYRYSRRNRVAEADLPEFAPVPLGSTGIEVPAHAAAELARRRAKFLGSVLAAR